MVIRLLTGTTQILGLLGLFYVFFFDQILINCLSADSKNIRLLDKRQALLIGETSLPIKPYKGWEV